MFVSAVKERVYTFQLHLETRHTPSLCTYVGQLLGHTLLHRNWFTPQAAQACIKMYSGEKPLWGMPLPNMTGMLAGTESGRLYAVVGQAIDETEPFHITVDTSRMDTGHKKGPV